MQINEVHDIVNKIRKPELYIILSFLFTHTHTYLESINLLRLYVRSLQTRSELQTACMHACMGSRKKRIDLHIYIYYVHSDKQARYIEELLFIITCRLIGSMHACIESTLFIQIKDDRHI